MHFGRLSVTAALALLSFGITPQYAWAWPGPGSTGGSFDDQLSCSYDKNSTVAPDPNNPSQLLYTSDGSGTCTFTQPQPGKKPPIVETANCTMHFAWPVTSSGCVSDGSGGYKVTYTGHCQSSQTTPVTIGYVSCPSAGFTAGTDGIWNQGFGVKSKPPSVIGMTTTQCSAFETAIGGPAFVYTEHFSDAACSNITTVDDANWQAGHSHSWSSLDYPYVETDKKGNIITVNNAFTTEAGVIGPVDIDNINPASYDSTCSTSGVTARINSVPQDAGTVPIDVTKIDQNTVAINGVPAPNCQIDASGSPRISCTTASTCREDGITPVGIPDSTGTMLLFTVTGKLSSGQPFESETVSRPYSP